MDFLTFESFESPLLTSSCRQKKTGDELCVQTNLIKNLPLKCIFFLVEIRYVNVTCGCTWTFKVAYSLCLFSFYGQTRKVSDCNLPSLTIERNQAERIGQLKSLLLSNCLLSALLFSTVCFFFFLLSFGYSLLSFFALLCYTAF